jgi:hypothetical protein
MGTEDSVSLFIREMNDMLDSHEVSTNLGNTYYNEKVLILMKINHMNSHLK